MTRAAAAKVALLLVALAACKGGQGDADKARPTPSGLPVPRYVSLKFNQVNARGGPGDDYRALWVYRTQGLPLQVIAETQEWRQVCDPLGAKAWVKGTGVDGRRTVMRLQPSRLPLLQGPDPSSRVQAFMEGRTIASLERCKDGWCRIKASGASGWAPESSVWGTDARPQCR